MVETETRTEKIVEEDVAIGESSVYFQSNVCDMDANDISDDVSESTWSHGVDSIVMAEEAAVDLSCGVHFVDLHEDSTSTQIQDASQNHDVSIGSTTEISTIGSDKVEEETIGMHFVQLDESTPSFMTSSTDLTENSNELLTSTTDIQAISLPGYVIDAQSMRVKTDLGSSLGGSSIQLDAMTSGLTKDSTEDSLPDLEEVGSETGMRG